jgi:hypothetical protein
MDTCLKTLPLPGGFLQISHDLLAGKTGGVGAGAGMEDPLGGQGHLPAGLGQDLEALSFEFQNQGAEETFFFINFDDKTGFHGRWAKVIKNSGNVKEGRGRTGFGFPVFSF